MARPFQDKFNKDSPLSPMSAGSASTPISYSVNVNRSKSKKWADTKPVDYGGDDWGDDYDDYEPPPLAKPTGLRQPGQVAQSPVVAGLSKIEGNKIAYGDLPPLPEGTQARSVSSPIRDRTNSLTQNDNHRAFSGGYGQPLAPAIPAAVNTRSGEISPSGPFAAAAQGNVQPVLHVSTQVPPVTGLRKVAQPSMPVEAQKPEIPAQVDELHSGVSSKYSEATSKHSEVRTPVSDFQSRRDFSPSAVPSPLQPSHSPAPQSSVPNSASSRFPPRKSSISRQTRPEKFETSQSPQSATVQKPWAEARSVSPGSPDARGISPSAGGRVKPLVRPSDIYKRVEEEKEKERQSIESGRPSMDSIIGSRTTEGTSHIQIAHPTQPTQAPLRGRSSSDSLGGNAKKGASHYVEPEYDYGRHLAPTLEPVSERKSEYAFEGFDPAAVTVTSEEDQEVSDPKELEESQRAIRHFSVSPKLPDLNRISGFGIDLFSKTGVGGTSHLDTNIPPIPENRAAANETDLRLRTQPSLGFTSVVHQAFEAESQSVPETPASSRPARSGSDSTGTAGISPIMSRVPGSITRNQNLEAQEATISAITEVDEPRVEPNHPESKQTFLHNLETDESERLPRPEYRRNMSTPSPGNSPARTPLVENGEKRVIVQESHASPISDHVVSPVDDENKLPAVSRPAAEREQSFRPHLPGGWVSYSTNASDLAVERDFSTHQRSETPNLQTERAHTPVSPISEMSDNEVDNEVELTPTTAERSLNQSALGAVAGAALGGVAAATFARRGREGSRSSSPTVTSAPATRTGLDNGALPTPDSALASLTNPYTAHTLDPRVVTATEGREVAPQVPAASQPVSSASTVPPTPPPKDTPALETDRRSPDYFTAPTVPLKPKTTGEIATTESLTSPIRPQILPTLSTHTSPQDEDSDKLRKEIVKTLSPTPSNSTETQRSLPPYPLEPATHGVRESTYEARESTYLPSEYDNYWESTNEANTELERGEEDGQGPPQGSESTRGPIQQPSELRTDPKTVSTVLPAPISSSNVAGGISTQSPAERPPLRPHRFSWEAGLEQVSAKPILAHPELQENVPVKDVPSATSPSTQPQSLARNGQAHVDQGPVSPSANTPAGEITKSNPAQDNNSLGSAQGLQNQLRLSDQAPSGGHLVGGIGIAAGVAGVSALASQKKNDDGPQRRLSLAEEKSPANVSSYAVSPEPPEDEHPARSSMLMVSPVEPSSASQASAPHPSNPDSIVTPSQRVSDTIKIRQFRDILSLQDPEQRIRAYDDTRDQFARMDTGLGEWIESLHSRHQIDSAGPWPNSTNPGIGDGRLKLQTQHVPLQQPYYQQYLNASPSTPVSQTQRPGTGTMPGSQQGLSSGGGKLSGQQNQSKGKGIFGGKATKAGKGLFSLGKNKFRGSGGGDKNSPAPEASPAPNTKAVEGRRSSWGMSMTSLTLPRLGRTDTSSQHSREATPTRQPPSQLGQDSPLRQTMAPTAAVGQSERSIMDEPVSAISTPSIPNATLQPQARDDKADNSQDLGGIKNEAKEVQERDGLRVPAPIGKQQPSWDPFNATPIAEEDGFHYDDRFLKGPPGVAAPVPLSTQTKIHQPTDGGASALSGARSTPNDADDWVLISKDAELSRAPVVQHQAGQPIQEAAPAQLPLSKFQAQPSTGPPQQYNPSGPEAPPNGYRTQTNFQPGAPRQELAPLQPHSGYQPPLNHQPQSNSQTQANYQPLPGPQPLPASEPSSDTQSSNTSHGGFRSRFIQHIRQRSSKDNAFPTDQPSVQQHVRQRPSKDNTLPNDRPIAAQNHNTEKRLQGPAEENQSPVSPMKQSPDFIGLPPIRRSSTFGIGFRPKAAKERFPIDDSDEETPDVDTGVNSSQAQKDARPQGATPTGPTVSSNDTSSRPRDLNASGQVVNGAGTPLLAVDNQTGQPLNESSGHPFIEGQNSETAAQSQERPTLTAKSSEYSQASGVGPIPPPMPAMPSDIPQHLIGGPPNTSKQSYGSTEARPEDGRRPNAARISQERRDTQTTPQRPLSFEQGGTYITHIRQPSQEGQRPSPQPTHQRGPSFDSQRPPPSSSLNQPYQGPPLSAGVYVPPPRTGPNQSKQFEQPPSSAQRYPELFKSELAKETSVDGLPANYYQRPISREDALLPRQQTSEYQLPGVGPPLEEPRSGRHSRRNSGLFKELGGRLSRSVSRDRGSTRDDEPQSPLRTTQSRNSHGRDVSEASVTSEETIDEKRRSRLGLFGTLRLESTPGPQQPDSGESLHTHLPPSRRDSAQMLQQEPTPLPPPPDKKKTFFGFGRSSTDDLKVKPNKLSRVSTNSITSEQEGKKKRFSGLTGMFSRQNADQEGKDSVVPAGAAAQDPRNYLRSSVSTQGSPYSGDPRQGVMQGFQHPQGQPRPNVQGGFAQQPPRYGPGPFPHPIGPTPNGAPGNFQPANSPLSPHQVQGQAPTNERIAAPPLGSPPAMNQGRGPPYQGQTPNITQSKQELQIPPGSVPQASQRQGPIQGQQQGPQNNSSILDTQGVPKLAALNGRPGPPGQLQAPQPLTQGLETRGNVQQNPPTSITALPRQIPPSERLNSLQQGAPPTVDKASLQQGPPIEHKGGLQQGPPLDNRSRPQQASLPTADRASSQQGQPTGFRGGPQQSPPIEHRDGIQQGLPLENRSGPQQGPPLENRSGPQQGLSPTNDRASLQQGQPANLRGAPQHGSHIEQRGSLQQGPPLDNRPGPQQGLSPTNDRASIQQGQPANLRGAPQQGPPIEQRGSLQQSPPLDTRLSLQQASPPTVDRAGLTEGQAAKFTGPPQQSPPIEQRGGLQQGPLLENRSGPQQGPPPTNNRASVQQGQPTNFRGAPQQGPPTEHRDDIQQGLPLDNRLGPQQGLPVDNRTHIQQGYPVDNRESFQQNPALQNRAGVPQGSPVNSTGPLRQGPAADNRISSQQGLALAHRSGPQQNAPLQQRGSYQQGPPVGHGFPPNPNLPSQQPQNHQYLAASPGQPTLHNLPSPQATVEKDPPGRSFWERQPPASESQKQPEVKSRKKTSTGIFSGLLGGRRSSAQPGKDDRDIASVSSQSTVAPKPLIQPQQQKQPQLMHPKPMQPRPIQPQVLQQQQPMQPSIRPQPLGRQQSQSQQMQPQQMQQQPMQQQPMQQQPMQQQQMQPQQTQLQPMPQQMQQQMQQQQMQQQMQKQNMGPSPQQQIFAPQGPPGPRQERGRPLTQEPQYAPLPIPGAYNLVRGDGNQLAPTPYDPRGLNQALAQGNSPYIYSNQGQPHPLQSPYAQGPPFPRGPPPNLQNPNVPSPLVLTGQKPDMETSPGLGPYQQSPRKSTRPLSTEDLVARSPARPQFGQQAPYQLTLPNEGDEDLEEEPLPNDQNVIKQTQLPLGGNQHVYNGVSTEGTPTNRPVPATPPLNTHPANPALRHPMSPATYPLPEETIFSPINPSASKLPPPAPPKWPGSLPPPTQVLDRSNTVDTQTDRSEVSRFSGQLNVPSQPLDLAQGVKGGPTSVTPPSPQITPQISPERSPAQVNSPHVAASQASDDIYSASPIPSPGPPSQGAPKAVTQVNPVNNETRPAQAENGNVQMPTSGLSPIKIPEQQTQQQHNRHLSPPLAEKLPVEEGKETVIGMGSRRRPSQEEKILVEEGMIRPGSANPAVQGQGQAHEDDAPSMSATSYPGQEWNPYGGGFEEWD